MPNSDYMYHLVFLWYNCCLRCIEPRDLQNKVLFSKLNGDGKFLCWSRVQDYDMTAE